MTMLWVALLLFMAPLLAMAIAPRFRNTRFAAFSGPVSVVIPAWNEGVTIERCIKSVLAQDYGHGYEVIVIGGGTDDTAAICDKYAHEGRIRFIREHEPRGKYRDLNDAIGKGRHEIVAVLDADAIAPATWLAHITAPLNDKNINVVSGRSVHAESRKNFFGRWNVFMLWLAGSIGAGLNAIGVNTVSGANMAFRKSFWRAHKFKKMLIEDVQFGVDSPGPFSTFFRSEVAVRTNVPDSYGDTYKQWGRWCRGLAEIAGRNKGLTAVAVSVFIAYTLIATLLPIAGMVFYALYGELYKSLAVYSIATAPVAMMTSGMRKVSGAPYTATCIAAWPAFIPVFVLIAVSSWLGYALKRKGYDEWTRVQR